MRHNDKKDNKTRRGLNPPSDSSLSVRLEMLHSHSFTLRNTKLRFVHCSLSTSSQYLTLLVSPWRHPDTEPMSHPPCTLVSTDGSRQMNVKVMTYLRQQVQRRTPRVACAARVPCQSPYDTRHFSSACDIPLHLHPAHMQSRAFTDKSILHDYCTHS